MRIPIAIIGVVFWATCFSPAGSSNALSQKTATESHSSIPESRLDSVPASLLGDWSLELESKLPAWMSIVKQDGQLKVFMRLYVGPAGPYKITEISGGKIKFSIRRQRKNAQPVVKHIEVGLVDGKLAGVIYEELANGKTRSDKFSGQKIPPMPKVAPDLSSIHFGDRITLFNGHDLTGWRPHESDKINGWSVEDGVLVNKTPKTDFSATGAHANLRTLATFEDFRLHIEFLIGENRNSGVYLRGMYEAQVVDRDSRMQGKIGPGSIFGVIAPSENAGKPGGQWQSYDITLVDRHITVVLNGKKVIDNQRVAAPTAGAIYTNPEKPGPIYLQGDHTAVSYRNIYLEPVNKK